MSNDVEELLRDGMERTTDEVRMAPELAGRLTGQAARRHRRWLFARARATGGAALAVAVLGVATGFALTSATAKTPGAPTVPRVQTTAHAGTSGPPAPTAASVLSHVKRALAATVGSAVASIVVTQGSGRRRLTSTSWFYQSARTQMWVDADPGAGTLTKTVNRVSGRTEERTETTINYPDRQWQQKTVRITEPSSAASCLPDDAIVPYSVSVTVFGALFSCGSYTVTGHQRVDGGPAIRLVMASPRSPRSGEAETIWVDASTYLPVRVLSTRPSLRVQTDVRWRPATAANLAHLEPSIPAGFTRGGGPVPVRPVP